MDWFQISKKSSAYLGSISLSNFFVPAHTIHLIKTYYTLKISSHFRYCAYFRNRSMYENADLILLPYNYIVDPSLRHKHNIQLEGNIVIFDEAHNLESICEESTSVSFSTTQISACIKETTKVLEMIINGEKEVRTQMDNTVVPIGTEIQETNEVKIEENDVAYLLDGVCAKDGGEKVIGIDGKVYPGEQMIELLSEAGFRKDMREAVSQTIDKIGQYLTAKAQNETIGEFVEKGVYLQEFSSFISTIYADKHASSQVLDSPACVMRNLHRKITDDSSAKYFQVRFVVLYITKHDSVITLNYWCFSPSVAMYLHSGGVRSVIVTSGILSPLDSFINNLGISFPVMLENQHAANVDQILCARIRSSQSGIDLCGTFHKQSSSAYVFGIGEVIVRACQIIPDGILVFFSSYITMNTCLKFWKTLKFGPMFIWKTILAYKEAFVEPKSKLELKAVLLQFRQQVREGSNGAILFAVCRAKVSEGIDFLDSESRGVIVIGIPYAPTMDPRTELKRQFLTKQRMAVAKQELRKNVSADEWYQVEAIRSVNQSIGRVLRHKNDFGVVILADSRFCLMSSKRFPSWMRECLKNYRDISDFEDECKQFFKKRNIEMRINQRPISSAMEVVPGFVCCRKRPEIKPNNDGLHFDIDALYSSEALAAFEKSIGIEDTIPKRPKRSCIFEELEEGTKKVNELVGITHSIDVDNNPIQSGTNLIIAKTKPKLRIKPNASLLFEDEVGTSEGEIKDLQSIEKSKRITLKMALTNYAADDNFQTLISTYAMETVPDHLEVFKGLYGYLQVNHRPKFIKTCRQLKLI
uniref:Helicase ATP-binding domain-containing protein n=1 Tax=Wuchereria bancrofti TaxID=6293 RepID=A0A1I8F0W0_WUCBA